MDQEKIGKLIAKLRKEKKLTQEQLGAKLGVNSKAVSKWECGVTTPDISIVNELSNILGITTNELLTGKQDLSIKRYKNLLSCTSNFFKKNKAFMIIIALLFVVNIILCIYFFNNYRQCQLLNFKLNNKDFYLDGYIVNYHQQKLIILKDIKCQSNQNGVESNEKISNLKLSILNEHDIIFSWINSEKFDENGDLKYYYINEITDNFSSVIVESENKNKFYDSNDKFKVVVEYSTKEKVVKEEYNLDVFIN